MKLTDNSKDEMYEIFFSKALFDIDYGFENLNPNNECKELKRLYKCFKTIYMKIMKY